MKKKDIIEIAEPLIKEGILEGQFDYDIAYNIAKEIIDQEKANSVSTKQFITEIFVAHVAEGIKFYDAETYTKIEQQLLDKLKLLYMMKIDIKATDVITVYSAGDPCFYKIKYRIIDITDTLHITYWVDDL